MTTFEAISDHPFLDRYGPLLGKVLGVGFILGGAANAVDEAYDLNAARSAAVCQVGGNPNECSALFEAEKKDSIGSGIGGLIMAEIGGGFLIYLARTIEKDNKAGA